MHKRFVITKFTIGEVRGGGGRGRGHRAQLIDAKIQVGLLHQEFPPNLGTSHIDDTTYKRIQNEFGMFYASIQLQTKYRGELG